MQINITTRDTITPDLRRIAAGMQNTRPLMAALGKQLEIDLRKHFMDRDSQPNKRGFPKKHFWRDIAKNTALTRIEPKLAEVSIASPELAFKITGGVITPKRAKALAIAISPEAYKAGSPRLFPGNLTLIPRPGKPSLLVEKSKNEKSFALHYILLKSVRQKADPQALPPQQAINTSLLARARTLLNRIIQ